jgi:hypothetical protein
VSGARRGDDAEATREMGLETGLVGVVRRLHRVAAPFVVTRYGNAFLQ